MILHEPEISRIDGRLRVHARIETRHPKLATLDRLWFEVDEASGLAVSDRADAFLVAMLPIAMACGESLEVRGRTSPRLAWGVRELQRIHFAWWPRLVRIVDVRCATLEEAPPERARRRRRDRVLGRGRFHVHALESHAGAGADSRLPPDARAA